MVQLDGPPHGSIFLNYYNNMFLSKIHVFLKPCISFASPNAKPVGLCQGIM